MKKIIIAALIILGFYAFANAGFSLNDMFTNPTNRGFGYRYHGSTTGTYWRTAMTDYWTDAMSTVWTDTMNTEIPE